MAEINDLDPSDGNNTARFPENMAPSAVNDGARELEGLLARGLKDTIDGVVTTTGSSTAYAAAANRALSAYYDGLQMTLEFHAETGATPTLNVDSVGAQSLVWPDGTALAAADIAANTFATVIYDESNTNWVVLSVPEKPLVAGSIGSTVQAYDADILKADTSDRIVANMGFTPVTDSSSSGAITFDFSTGCICKTTLTENITGITLSGAAAGDTLKIWFTQAAGGYTVSGWPAAVKWAGATAPTMSSASGAVDVITLEYDGTNYYGAYTQDHR